MMKFFYVNVNKYDKQKSFVVTRPSSLNNPQNNSVMFITKENMDKYNVLLEVNNCIVIWPEEVQIPNEILEKHVVVTAKDPRLGFAMFFRDNNIIYEIPRGEYELIDGSFLEKGATIGLNTVIYPGTYIGKDVVIGDNCYIGSGVKLIGRIKIGNNVIIRENTVIGSTDLTTCRDENGLIVSTPQFGGVRIEDNVHIGASTVISRGAIDDTIIQFGCRIDSCCYISHNVNVGLNTIVVGESILFGSSSIGCKSLVSGNCTIRDGVKVGDNVLIGMGSVVVKDIPSNKIVKGNPAH